MFPLKPHFSELQRFENEKTQHPFRSQDNRNFGLDVTKNDQSTPKDLRFRENFHQYMADTTLHGLKYVGNRSLSAVERVFFTLSCLFVLLLSIYFISNAYVKWSASPIIISQNPSAKLVTDIPFPAVTICNINSVRRSAIENLPEDSVEFSLAQSICSIDNNITTTVAKAATWQQFQGVLMNVSQPCEDMLSTCYFGGMEFECSEIFVSVLSDEGRCCTFNLIHTHFFWKPGYNHSSDFDQNDDVLTGTAIDWTAETGFSVEKAKWTDFTYPRASIDASKRLGLKVVLNVDTKEYFCASQPSFGFNVLLHSPNEYPNMRHFGMSIGGGFETHIIFSPVLSEASESVRRLSPSVRRCYFENENFLEFYRTYTRKNCKMECMTRIYRRHCGCVPFFMPRGDDSIQICKVSDRECIDDVMIEISLQTNSSFVCPMKCFPGCYSLEYDSVISMTPLLPNWDHLRDNNLSSGDAALLRIFPRKKFYRSQRIDELVSFTDFLSNVGGLLGLFMGFSFFSIVELIYFMTLRPYYIHVRYYESHREGIRQIMRKTPTCFGVREEKINRIQVKAVSDVKNFSHKWTEKITW